MFIKIIILFSLSLTSAFSASKVIGGEMHHTPDWFKVGFLDFNEDAEEAAKNGKHLMLFLDLDGCPYCTKMIKDNLSEGTSNIEYAKKVLDVVQINVKGSREITWKDDETMSEKTFAQAMNAPFSPTMIFFDGELNEVLRLNGYRNPSKFKIVLDYINNKYYKEMTLSQYMKKVKTKNIYELKDNQHFKKITDLSNISKPLLVIFESSDCSDCKIFHENTLKDEYFNKAISEYTVVRFDSNSNEDIITPEGNKTTPQEWVKEIDLDYRPGMLLYNEGILQETVDALLYKFHLAELLNYVSFKEYENHNTYLDYLRVKQVELLSEGKTIDLGK